MPPCIAIAIRHTDMHMGIHTHMGEARVSHLTGIPKNLSVQIHISFSKRCFATYILVAKYLCQEDILGGNYTALLWLCNRSCLRRSCLPGNFKAL